MPSHGAVESGLSQKTSSSCNIWLISNRLLESEIIACNLLDDPEVDRVIAYKISDLAKYMVNPNSIEVTDKLVGCKICFKKPAFSKTQHKIQNYLNKVFAKKSGAADFELHEETLISDQFHTIPDMKDPFFQNHINTIKELLTPYDTLIERISELDPATIQDIAGICDDPEGNRKQLDLSGTIAQKIDYIFNHIQKEICAIYSKAYLTKGLFEMRGFDFESYDSENSSQLIIVRKSGINEAYVLTACGEVAFHVEETDLVKYLHFFQASLKTNRQLQTLLNDCVNGHIRPLRLLFTKELDIDYFKADLPEIYREVFATNDITLNAKNTILQALNQKQIGIVVKYIPVAQQGDGKPLTCVYVMHDVEALDTIKTTLPHLYMQLDRKLGVLETQKYYLMDSMKV